MHRVRQSYTRTKRPHTKHSKLGITAALQLILFGYLNHVGKNSGIFPHERKNQDLQLSSYPKLEEKS